MPNEAIIPVGTHVRIVACPRWAHTPSQKRLGQTAVLLENLRRGYGVQARFEDGESHAVAFEEVEAEGFPGEGITLRLAAAYAAALRDHRAAQRRAVASQQEHWAAEDAERNARRVSTECEEALRKHLAGEP